MFKVDTRVKIIGIVGDLQGKTGTVIAAHTFFYNKNKIIVLLDEPVDSGDKAAIVHTMCLEPLI